MMVWPAILTALFSAACSASSARAPAPASLPTVVVSVPATCADVWPRVFDHFDASWTVTVLPPSKEEEAPPFATSRDAFLAAVPGLDGAVAHMDALDRDVFYVRLHTGTLTALATQYPSMDPALLERAKTEACRQRVAGREDSLAKARKLLAEVERSPSAYLPELRAKLHEARAEAAAVLQRQPEHSEARELLARIDTLLAHLAPRGRPEHPTEAEAAATLERLEALVKGGGARGEVERVHTLLRRLVLQLQRETIAAATLYESRARFLWDSYASRMTKVGDVCAGCPGVDLATLARGFDSPRLLGAGDYSLDDLEAMAEDVTAAKPRYTTLLTGDFDGDGSVDVALVGRGRRNGTDTLFLLVAARQDQRFRAVFLQPLDWSKAALAVKDGAVVLSMVFTPTDDFWWVRWHGACCVLRYAGEDLHRERRGERP